MIDVPPWFKVPVSDLEGWAGFPPPGPERSKAIVDLALREAAREMTYAEYLQTDHWRDVSERAKKRNGGACCHCQDSAAVDAHHVTYLRLGCEDDSDVIGLCRSCHDKWHENWRRAL